MLAVRPPIDPVDKALWFIESHFTRDISLEEIAAIGGVSRYHMTRAFGAATGQSVMRYVRGRRLRQAARALADGAPDMLAVALDVGYGSLRVGLTSGHPPSLAPRAIGSDRARSVHRRPAAHGKGSQRLGQFLSSRR
jgi:hypothetical protein